MSATPLSEDIPWEALAAFLAGELSDAERPLVERWLAEDPRHEELLAVLRQGWQASGSGRRYDGEAALRWIKGHAQEPVEAAAPRRQVQVLRMAIPVRRHAGVRRALLAASIAAVAAGGWWIASGELALGSRAHTSSAAFTEYRAARGQRLALKLPDGSSVTLGPDSRLRLAPGYGRPARAVELEGEGYFEVTHDDARPFSVRTGNALVRDLGTRFVVQAHPGDRVTDVVVAEGVVAMGRPRRPAGGAGSTAPLSGDSLVLQPGHRGRLTEAGALVLASNVRLDDYLGWTEGRLVIPDLPVAEALRRIGRWYDVRARLADARAEAEVRGRTVNAVFRDEPAAEAMRLIAAPFALVVEHDSGGFVLRAARK